MSMIRKIKQYLNMLAILFGLSFPVTSSATITTIDESLLLQAESGVPVAQLKLATVYQEQGKTDSAHYWLIKSAVAGNRAALERLGRLHESDDNNPLHSLEMAHNWYLVAGELGSSEAEAAYGRVLEKQFNLRRTKQLSSIDMLDKQANENTVTSGNTVLSHTISDSHTVETAVTTSTPPLSTGVIVFIAVITLIVITTMLLVAITHLQAANSNKYGHDKKELSNTIVKQSKTIKSLQKHLFSMHIHLNKQQKALQTIQSNHTLALAYAVLGFHPKQVADEKQLKLRYKKLCRIYHPDISGSEEEMKQLNMAFETVKHHISPK